MTENEYNYSANIVAEITDQAIAFQEDMMGSTLERWGYHKSDVENALIELERYRKIGTMEECQEAVEKTKVKKVKEICGALGEKYESPECGSSLYDEDLIAGYCKWCGQKVEE